MVEAGERRNRRLLTLVTLVALSAGVRAGRTGHLPDPPDLEGRLPPSLQLTVPASLLLPSLVAETASARSGRAAFSQGTARIPSESIPVDLNHLVAEEKLQRYFSHFELPPGVCQERLICEMTSDPGRFQPATALFLRALVTSDRYPAAADTGAQDVLDVDGEEPVQTRLQRLQAAAATAGHCHTRYAGCPIRPEELFSEAALRFWRWSAGLVNVEFSSLEL